MCSSFSLQCGSSDPWLGSLFGNRKKRGVGMEVKRSYCCGSLAEHRLPMTQARAAHQSPRTSNDSSWPLMRPFWLGRNCDNFAGCAHSFRCCPERGRPQTPQRNKRIAAIKYRLTRSAEAEISHAQNLLDLVIQCFDDIWHSLSHKELVMRIVVSAVLGCSVSNRGKGMT